MIRKFLADTRDLFTDLLAWLGLSPGRVAWKRRRWRRRVDEVADDAEQLRRSVAATHRMCRECRALVPRRERVCPECGAPMAGVPSGGATRLVRVLAPSAGSASTTTLGVIIVMYIAIALTAPGGFSFSASSQTLYRLGAKWTPDILAGQWWRLINPVYLHGSVLHLFFNAMALANLGPAIEMAVGGRRWLVLFGGCGVASFVASALLAPFRLSIGASGALFGLIGFGIVHGRMRGGMLSSFSDNLVRWAIFGFLISILPQVDWAAHAGGFAAGAAAGLVVGRSARTSAIGERLWTIGAAASVLAPLAGFALALLATRTG